MNESIMIDKISYVTRQDIIDVIRNGFVVSFDEPQYDSISGNYIVSYRAKISYHGRLDELRFLERLYDFICLRYSKRKFAEFAQRSGV